MIASTQTILISIERQILETAGFDFRTRQPHKLLAKYIALAFAPEIARRSSEYADFCRLAFDISVDMYKTAAPMKQTSSTLAIAVVSLAARLTDEQVLGQFEDTVDYQAASTYQGAVVETVFDLLELYTQSQKNTRVGQRYETSQFVDIQFALVSHKNKHAAYRFQTFCQACVDDGCANNIATSNGGSGTGTTAYHSTTPSPLVSLPTPGSTTAVSTSRKSKRNIVQEGTLRFHFYPERARHELDQVERHFAEEYEEYEIEVEEEVPPDPESTPTPPPSGPRHNGNSSNGLHPDRERNVHYDDVPTGPRADSGTGAWGMHPDRERRSGGGDDRGGRRDGRHGGGSRSGRHGHGRNSRGGGDRRSRRNGPY